MSIRSNGPKRPFLDGAGPYSTGLALVRAERDDRLSTRRLLEIRGRVLDGSYNAPAMLDAIAAAMLRHRD